MDGAENGAADGVNGRFFGAAGSGSARDHGERGGDGGRKEKRESSAWLERLDALERELEAEMNAVERQLGAVDQRAFGTHRDEILRDLGAVGAAQHAVFRAHTQLELDHPLKHNTGFPASRESQSQGKSDVRPPSFESASEAMRAKEKQSEVLLAQLAAAGSQLELAVQKIERAGTLYSTVPPAQTQLVALDNGNQSEDSDIEFVDFLSQRELSAGAASADLASNSTDTETAQPP